MPIKPSSARLLHFFIGLLIAGLALTLILLLAVPIGFYAMAMYLAPSLPSVNEIKTANLEMPLQVYSRDDKLIGQYGNRISLPVAYDQIPEDMIHAFLAAEDSSFFEHSGISIKGLGRAVTEVVTDDEGQTGGSTITMQVAKNYFLSSERTINRKLTELFLARKIEDELSKNEILTLYVNKIYLGEGAYGIRAAAKKYYSKSLEDLSIAQIAMLAGLPKAPSKYNPVANPQRALTRRNWIIGRMLALGYITQQQHDEAVAEPIGLHIYQEKLDVNMPYLAEMARYALVNRYGEQVINSGWRVKLTVDSNTQQQAESAILKGLMDYDRRHGWRGAEANDEPLKNFRRYGNMYPAKVNKVQYRSFEAELPDGKNVTVNWSGMSWAKKYYSTNRVGGYPNTAREIVSVNDIVRLMPSDDGKQWRLVQVPKVEGSLVSLNPESGAVNALVGGFDFTHSKFNRALQGWRQPGSTIKPLIYTAALEKGYSPDSIVSDRPLKVGSWEPKNSDGRFYGDITLRRALYLSRNLVSIRLLRSVGITDARNLLDQFGLDKEKLPTTLSLALGAGQATPLQMATAYATFANGGHRIQPYFIEQIYDFDNNLLFQANPQQACALCFNNKLEKLNEAQKKAYQESLDKANNPQATDKEATKPEETSNSDSPDNEQADSATEESKTTEDLTIYTASPAVDRLHAPLTQYQAATQAPRILSASTAYQMAGILRDVVQRGTATRAKVLGRNDIGGKTGTTNDYKDGWFAGFHPTNVAIVWLGFDQPESLGNREYGGVVALPVWIDFMKGQLENVPQQWVSLNNRAKSKKQKQDILEVTDEGVVAVDSETGKKKAAPTSASSTPPKPKAQQRAAPPEPDATPTTSAAPTSDSVPQNPLSVTPVDQMPPMPN
ncbi:penicillin-binding protein 1A [Psychrobacter pygoscelis]|uniref:penicillin-binding protein 1A n=1 Tax=Psychrobacter pygoscelis TaxID=2488563 RepID=UPI0010394F28|nr:transglycosylase domain-containing protein [Psychrobacter pygoscelis]